MTYRELLKRLRGFKKKQLDLPVMVELPSKKNTDKFYTGEVNWIGFDEKADCNSDKIWLCCGETLKVVDTSKDY